MQRPIRSAIMAATQLTPHEYLMSEDSIYREIDSGIELNCEFIRHKLIGRQKMGNDCVNSID